MVGLLVLPAVVVLFMMLFSSFHVGHSHLYLFRGDIVLRGEHVNNLDDVLVTSVHSDMLHNGSVKSHNRVHRCSNNIGDLVKLLFGWSVVIFVNRSIFHVCHSHLNLFHSESVLRGKFHNDVIYILSRGSVGGHMFHDGSVESHDVLNRGSHNFSELVKLLLRWTLVMLTFVHVATGFFKVVSLFLDPMALVSVVMAVLLIHVDVGLPDVKMTSLILALSLAGVQILATVVVISFPVEIVLLLIDVMAVVSVVLAILVVHVDVLLPGVVVTLSVTVMPAVALLTFLVTAFLLPLVDILPAGVVVTFTVESLAFLVDP